MKIKLKSTAPHRHGRTNVLVHSGETTFNTEGIAEVDVTEKQLEDMLNSYSDLVLYEEAPKKPVDPIIPQINENELGKSKDEDNDIGGDKKEDEEDDELSKASVEELKAFAISEKFPEEEWLALDHKELVDYLKAKI